MTIIIEDFFTKPYCVYAHYVDDELVYIGSGELSRATNINTRKPAHFDTLSSGSAKVVIMTRFDELDEARDMEKNLIKTCRPRLNYVHNQGFEKPKPRYERVTGTRLATLMGFLSEVIRNGDPSPSNEYLSFLCDCSTSNIIRMLQQLERDGYITIDNAKTPQRIFHFGPSEFFPAPSSKESEQNIRMRTQAQQIMDILRRASEANEPCPSNADLAAVTGSKPSQPGKIISRLKKKGVIRVEMVGKNKRVIHIGEHSTAPTADHNIKGVATIERVTRARDYIRV